MSKSGYVYILSNGINRVLYTGVTTDLVKRVYQHKNKITKGFSAKYNVNKLVYHEIYENPADAISREKQLKAGSRAKKIKLVEKLNPSWDDLCSEII